MVLATVLATSDITEMARTGTCHWKMEKYQHLVLATIKAWWSHSHNGKYRFLPIHNHKHSHNDNHNHNHNHNPNHNHNHMVIVMFMVLATLKWQEPVLAIPITKQVSRCRHRLQMARSGSCHSHNYPIQPVSIPFGNGKNQFLPLPLTNQFRRCRHRLQMARTGSCHSHN